MGRRQIAVIDSETDPFKKGRIPKPFIWGFYDGLEYVEFSETPDLISFLRKQRIVVYAHNGGKFDYHFLLDYLDEFDEIMIINGRIAKFKIGVCEFRDSFNILPVGLAQFEKMEFDYALMEEDEREKPENKEKISEYLRSDCVNLFNMVTEFIARFGVNLTLAGTAMKQWSKMYDRKPPKTDSDFYCLFGQFYYGGRVQCFQTGIIEKPFQVVDINSAYPYAMLSNHPISIDYWYQDGKPNNLTGDLFIQVKAISKGALPFKTLKGELTFPDDDEEREYFVTGWEIITAIETKTVIITEWIRYYSFFDLTNFEEYIKYFYEERRKAKATGDKAGDLFSKLLMNSLYGKFGSNPAQYKKFMIVPMDAVGWLEDTDYDFGGELGPWGLAQRGLEDEEMRYYNVATAASITGFVRAYLWRAICNCGGVLYCDTDSISAHSIGNIPIGPELGKWKVEGDFDRAGISGKKLYIFDGPDGVKKASKGAKLAEAELWKIAAGETVIYEPENPTFSVKKKPTFVNRRIRGTAKSMPLLENNA